ncbi:hypothetical protein CRG98_034295 [Punica granatum]|uniref:Uncharacterized protein n=1 Tax=Punica granatum TaxID=22663 RepID=A0A2I0IMU4_PUNGR|nr:hypothetical protein CRG98_034295 [Punica granatum]
MSSNGRSQPSIIRPQVLLWASGEWDPAGLMSIDGDLRPAKSGGVGTEFPVPGGSIKISVIRLGSVLEDGTRIGKRFRIGEGRGAGGSIAGYHLHRGGRRRAQRTPTTSSVAVVAKIEAITVSISLLPSLQAPGDRPPQLRKCEWTDFANYEKVREHHHKYDKIALSRAI